MTFVNATAEAAVVLPPLLSPLHAAAAADGEAMVAPELISDLVPKDHLQANCFPRVWL